MIPAEFSMKMAWIKKKKIRWAELQIAAAAILTAPHYVADLETFSHIVGNLFIKLEKF